MAVLAVLAVAFMVADIWTGSRPEGFSGPPPPPRWRIASGATALICLAVAGLAIVAGTDVRLASGWLGSTDKWTGVWATLMPGLFAGVAASMSCTWGDQRNSLVMLSSHVLQEEKVLLARAGRWNAALVALILVAPILMHWDGPGARNVLAALIGSFAVPMLGLLIQHHAARPLARFERKSEDPDLLALARSLGAERGRHVWEALVDEGIWGRTLCRVTDMNGHFVVSRRLMDTFSREELKFALARAMAPGIPYATPSVVLPPLIGGAAIALACIQIGKAPDQLIQWGFLAAAGVAMLVIGTMSGLRRAARLGQIAADVHAMRMTGRPDAAESAIRKLAAPDGSRSFGEAQMADRIAAVREASGQSGPYPARKRPVSR
ncbi:MAG TPA: hypothetical protein VGM37_05335 [Armatimonadota bacterium]|jgi:hypothetical protein